MNYDSLNNVMNEYTIKIIIIKKSTYAVNQSLNLAALGRCVNCFVINPVFNDHIIVCTESTFIIAIIQCPISHQLVNMQ